ncbi:hypothetical protein FALCPG4_018609 [Fusarium falciforme]
MSHFNKRTTDSERRLHLSPPVSPVQHNSTIAALRKRKRASPSPLAESDDDANHVPDAESDIQDVIICASTVVFSDDETEDEREDSPPAKRSLARRSISFDQVFQNGNAATKHVIIQYPLNDGDWFILRCDEHDVSFKNQRGAAAHLRSSKHGGTWQVSTSMVIKNFGIEVIDCDATLAGKNNLIALESGQEEAKPRAPKKRPITYRTTSAREKRSKLYAKRAESDQQTNKRRQLKQGVRNGIPSPAPGQIYLAYDEAATSWLPALILPHNGLEDLSTPSSLENLGLMGHIPECYAYNPQTKELSWKSGYGNGEALTMERRFPAIFFDGSKFPEESAVGWVAAVDIQVFDVFDSPSKLIPNLKSAQDFIRRRFGPTELPVKVESPKPELKSDSCSVSPQEEPAPPVDNLVSSGTDTALSETTVLSSLVTPVFSEGQVEKLNGPLPGVQDEAAGEVSSTLLHLPSSTPSKIADRESEAPSKLSGRATPQTALELDTMEVDIEAPAAEKREASLLATVHLEPLASDSDAMQIDTVETIPKEEGTSLPAPAQPDLSVSQEAPAQDVLEDSFKPDEAAPATMDLPKSSETLPQAADLETKSLSPITLPTPAQPVPSDIDFGQQTTAHSVDTVSEAVEKLASSSEKTAEPEAFSQPADSKGDSPEVAVASKMVDPTPPSPGPCLNNQVESRNQSISEHDDDAMLAAEASIAMEMLDYELCSPPHEEAAALSPTSPSPSESRIQGRRRSSAEPAKQSAPVADMSITMELNPQPSVSQPDSKPGPLFPKRVLASPHSSLSPPAPSVDHCVESHLSKPGGRSTPATEAPSLEPVSPPAEPEIFPKFKTPKVKIAQPISPCCLKAPVLQTSKFDSLKPTVSFKAHVQSFSRPAIGGSVDNPIDLKTVFDMGSPSAVQCRLSAGRQQTPYSYDRNYSPMRTNDMSVPRNLIHRAHVRREFFNHTNADLHNLQSSSTSLAFPRAIWGEELPSIHLPLARLSAAQSQSSSIPGFRFLSSPPTTHTLGGTPAPQFAKASPSEQTPSP